MVPAHKKNLSEPSNYRLISLLSVVGKLLEQDSVICHRLSEHRLLSDRQFGFRPGHSTADLLTVLSQGWQDAMDKGLDTLVMALDTTGAFDVVWHARLVEKLCAKSIQSIPLELLENYLQGRTFRVVINGQTSYNHPLHRLQFHRVQYWARSCRTYT